MRVAVIKEDLDRRVALVPESVARLAKARIECAVEAGAGAEAGFSDAAYQRAGAIITAQPAMALEGAQVVLRVRRPTPEQTRGLHRGQLLIGLLQPTVGPEWTALLEAQGVVALSMERVPRTTKAQSMDALSSQATIAGYKAVLIGAAALPKLLPMMTTAAGTLAPAKVLILGAGVAGLQAIATARRLGGVVSAFDVRPAVKEQVQSLGASFVDAVEVVAEGAGGYAKELATEQQQRVHQAIGRVLASQDLVISSAQIPGRPAPLLLTAEMVHSMRPGSVIVDLAAESGGNCALTRAGATVDAEGVSILGPVDLPSTVPTHASQMYSRNLEALLLHLVKDGQLALDPKDEIVGPMIFATGSPA